MCPWEERVRNIWAKSWRMNRVQPDKGTMNILEIIICTKECQQRRPWLIVEVQGALSACNSAFTEEKYWRGWGEAPGVAGERTRCQDVAAVLVLCNRIPRSPMCLVNIICYFLQHYSCSKSYAVSPVLHEAQVGIGIVSLGQEDPNSTPMFSSGCGDWLHFSLVCSMVSQYTVASFCPKTGQRWTLHFSLWPWHSLVTFLLPIF